jgi:hypothetical protein
MTPTQAAVGACGKSGEKMQNFAPTIVTDCVVYVAFFGWL